MNVDIPVRQSGATTECNAARRRLQSGRGRDASYLAPPAQNRTCGLPAYGLYGAFFVKGASRHFCRALYIITPFFCSTRAASILPSRPHIAVAVARSGGQGRRFFSAAEGLSLTDASTAAGPRASGFVDGAHLIDRELAGGARGFRRAPGRARSGGPARASWRQKDFPGREPRPGPVARSIFASSWP